MKNIHCTNEKENEKSEYIEKKRIFPLDEFDKSRSYVSALVFDRHIKREKKDEEENARHKYEIYTFRIEGKRKAPKNNIYIIFINEEVLI